MKILLLLLLLPLLFSCRSGTSSEEAKSLDIALPDVILEEASFTLGQEGENPLYLEGDKLEFYLDEDIVYLFNITFRQLDEEESLFITGSAGYGKINTETKVAELSGGVELEKVDEELRIRADGITFDSGNSTVESPGKASIYFKGGTIDGENLSADLKRNTLELEVIQKGELEL